MSSRAETCGISLGVLFMPGWDVFAEGTDLAGHTSAVFSYINFFADSVWETKTVPQPEARWGPCSGHGTLRWSLGTCRPIEEHFHSNNPRSVWQGIKTLTGYRDSYTADNSTHRTLADSLNHFFSRFDCQIAADICHPCWPGSTPVCLPCEQVDRGSCQHSTPHSPYTPAPAQHLCKSDFCLILLSI